MAVPVVNTYYHHFTFVKTSPMTFNPKFLLLLGVCTTLLVSCKKDDDPVEEPDPQPSGPQLIFRFDFDENQPRLDNLGNPAVLPAGHAAQSPQFNKISAHYIELAPTAFTWLGDGEVLYNGPSTSAGGDVAINFDQAKIVSEGENFISIPLSSIAPGSYDYIRVSLAYQNYDIDYLASGFDLTGTVASFIGYNTYITDFIIDTESITVNDDRLQGYWAFETNVLGTTYTTSGQAPEGATTVPNPIWDTSPIPAGSCVVTGPFSGGPLVISDYETTDRIITLSLSTNQSFEWVEVTEDGKYEPSNNEFVVDMGIRGLIPIEN